MLIDSFLPNYDYRTCRSVVVRYSQPDIYTQMLEADLSRSGIIRWLFRLRGMPAALHSIRDMEQLGFIRLQEQPGEEILFGMITRHPMFSNCLQQLTAAEFLQPQEKGTIRAVINFSIRELSADQYRISTETRLLCGSRKMRWAFRPYWIIVKPFSLWIRSLMLRQLKDQLEHSAFLAVH